jgi:hypothetical protein
MANFLVLSRQGSPIRTDQPASRHRGDDFSAEGGCDVALIDTSDMRSGSGSGSGQTHRLNLHTSPTSLQFIVQ